MITKTTYGQGHPRAMLLEQEMLLPYSCRQIFDLLWSVDYYPEYISACKSVEVLSTDRDINNIAQENFNQEVALMLSSTGMNETLVVDYQAEQPYILNIKQISGPFEYMRCHCVLNSHSAGCMLNIKTDCALSSILLNTVARRLAPPMAERCLEIMRTRADSLYANDSQVANTP